MTKKLSLFVSVGLASIILTGCGGDSSDGGSLTSYSAYLSDSRIEGVTYTCGSLTGVTDQNGTFNYNSGCTEVEFSIGGITLGSIPTANLAANATFYPADILGLDRNNTTDSKLVEMLQLLQSLDSDGRADNGITINQNLSNQLSGVTLSLDNNASNLTDINSTLSNLGVTLVNSNFAIANYEQTLRNDENLTVNTISQDTLDTMDLQRMAEELAQQSDFRVFTYTPQWNTGAMPTLSFSQDPLAATTEDQTYAITATLTKGNITQDINLNETIPFSQNLRDREEVDALKTFISANSNPRDINYTQQWSSGEAYDINYSEVTRQATVEDQNYTVTASITKGTVTDTTTFSEFVPFSQTLRDLAEVARIKNELSQSVAPRAFTYTQQWSTGDIYDINFSEPTRPASVETQFYTVTANISKGNAVDAVDFNETVPFSQLLRDQVEVQNLINNISTVANPRTYTYIPQWPTGESVSIGFSENRRIPTALDQTYTVIIYITKGSVTSSTTFMETVPTNNVVMDLSDDDVAFINDQYKNQYSTNNGAIFEKVGDESKFVGTAFAVDASSLSSTISNSQELLNYMINNSGISYSLSTISSSISTDGSLSARYEFNGLNSQVISTLESLLGAFNYSITNLDTSIYTTVTDVYVDVYVEYDSTNNSYIIIVVSDKTLDIEREIIKIVNKDSIVQSNEVIANETESFVYTATQPLGDFLFVMDDSGSMSNEQAAAIDAIGRTFASSTVKYGLDWQAYVVGSSTNNTYSSLVVDPSVGDINKTKLQLNLGTYGSGTETGLKRAYYALTNDITTRNNSSMNIINVTDERDSSSLADFGETNTDFTDSYFVQNKIPFHSILLSSIMNSNNYAYDMTIATGGEFADLSNYTSGYDRMMDLAVRGAVAKSSPVKLSHPALASSITVFVDDTQQNNWEYDPNAYAIVFDANNTPTLDANVTVVYSHLDYSSMVQSAKDEFDALANEDKRAYTNSNIDVIFDPAQPITPLADQDQTYSVNVTFSKLGYSATTSYDETVEAANFYTVSNSGWIENNKNYVSQIDTSYTTATLEVKSLVDTTFYIDFKDNSYDRLTLYKNNTQIGYYNTYNQDEAIDINVSANDTIKIEHYKNYTSSSSDYNTTLNIYTQQDLVDMLPVVKAEFDALANDKKRSFTSRLVNVTFDPVQAATPLQDQDQTYSVTVTFEKDGTTLSSTYDETAYSINNTFSVVSNTLWNQNGTTFVSAVTTDYTDAILELSFLRDTTIDFNFNEYYSEYFYIYRNNSSSYELYYASDSIGNITVNAGDTIKFVHEENSYGDYVPTPNPYNVTININN